MNLPNKLTTLRIILIPIFLIVLSVPFQWGVIQFGGVSVSMTSLIAAIIFVAASITDNLDGRIARKERLVTNFGKFADPLADKLLTMTAFVMLTASGAVPAWVTVIIIWRELSVTGLRLLVVEQSGTVVAAALPGKIKTASQFVAITALLLNNMFFEAINFPFATIMLYICLFFTIYSGVSYFYNARDVFSDGFK